jgi:hypothetical protein
VAGTVKKTNFLQVFAFSQRALTSIHRVKEEKASALLVQDIGG